MKKTLTCLCLAALLWALAVCGCVKAKYYPAEGGQTYPPTQELVVLSYYPDQPYEVIGTLRARGGSKEKILARLKEKAMQAGAEGIIVKPAARIGNEYSSERKTEFSKTELLVEAIAFRFKTAGQP